MTFDLQAFVDFFSDYKQRYITFATNYLRDKNVAEDLVAESIFVFWKNKDSLPQDTNVPAYVLGTLKYKCIDYLRRQKISDNYTERQKQIYTWDLQHRITALESFVPEDVLSKEIIDLVNKAILTIPEEARKIYVMSRIEGKSHREIAGLLNISEKKIEHSITKTNKVLRQALKDYLTVAIACFFMF